jgi:hypothetical protein
MAKKLEVYKCDFCPKFYHNEKVCINHEKWCKKNPNNKHICFNCRFLIYHDYEYREVLLDYVTGEKDQVIENYPYFECVKLIKILYPFQVEKKKLIEKFPEQFKDNVRMPLQCGVFRSKQEND